MVSSVSDLSKVSVDSVLLPMDALKVEFMRDPNECRSRHEIDTYTRIKLPDGRRCVVSDRFWNSWCSLQSQGRSVFDLFSHSEVFNRISKTVGSKVRVAIEANKRPDFGGQVIDGELLSCTHPTKPILPMADVVELINKYEGKSVQYERGVVSSTFDCPFPTPYTIVGEDYHTQFTMQMPVDGYGLPLSYLALLRLICLNGVVGMTKAFKTSFQLGKGEDHIKDVLHRAMTTFSAEEGFHSFKLRMEAAAQSWASLDEASRLCKVLNQAMHGDKMPVARRVEIIEKLDEMCGDPLKTYGLAGRQELSARRARTIPVNTSIYEMITFASEVATHDLHATTPRNAVNGWVGTTISTEYDLENSLSEFPDWKDFFVKDKKQVQLVVQS